MLSKHFRWVSDVISLTFQYSDDAVVIVVHVDLFVVVLVALKFEFALTMHRPVDVVLAYPQIRRTGSHPTIHCTCHFKQP